MKTAPPYDIQVQVDIVIACYVLHNFIKMNGGHTFDEELLEDHLDDVNLNEENYLNSALASADEAGTSRMCRFSQREKDEWSRFRENLKENFGTNILVTLIVVSRITSSTYGSC